ncbi:MAG: TetR/AcrR family transcriptional regulator [Nevskiales bacterium]|nr:TetR/AcrR family transcriptional regulator [Nevskiales bacterium]
MAYKRSPLMEERLAANRQRILQAARQLVAAGGLREAQISAVAAEAGLSTGAIYRYFPSKAELFVDVLNEAVRQEIEILDVILAGPGSAAEHLAQCVESFVSRALRGPNLAYAFIAEPAEPEVDAARIRCRMMFGDVFKRVLQDGIERGEFPPQNVDASAACIVGAYTEALVGPIAPATRSVRSQDRLIESVRDFCLRAVGATAVPPAKPPARPRRRARTA